MGGAAAGAGAHYAVTAVEALKFLGCRTRPSGQGPSRRCDHRNPDLLARPCRIGRGILLCSSHYGKRIAWVHHAQTRLHAWHCGVYGDGASRVVCGEPGGGMCGGGNRRAPSPTGASFVGPPRDEADWYRLSQTITVTMNAICDSLQRVHTAATITLL